MIPDGVEPSLPACHAGVLSIGPQDQNPMTEVGFEPTASEGLNFCGLPFAYIGHQVARVGLEPTASLILSQCGLPLPTRLLVAVGAVGFEPTASETLDLCGLPDCLHTQCSKSVAGVGVEPTLSGL